LSQPVDELAFINNDDNAFGRLGHNLLANERRAETLEQIQLRRDFVGSIHGHVNARILLEAG